MPKLIYLGDAPEKVSYQSDPHTHFRPTADDPRPHAEVPRVFGDFLVNRYPDEYAWEQQPADPPAVPKPPKERKGRTKEAVV